MEGEVQGLLNLVRELGGRIEVVDGQANLMPPADPKLYAKLMEILPDLTRLKAEIVRHCQGLRIATELPGEHCEECEATVYGEGPEVVRLCRMLMCPYWKKGCPEAPEWFAEERNKEEFRRRGNKRRAA